jgi:integrase
MLNRSEESASDLTVASMVRKYIDIISPVESPNTINGYESIYRTHIEKEPFGSESMNDLTADTTQKWINSLVRGRKPKTVSNIYGLVSAAMSEYYPDKSLQIKLPAKIKAKLYTPSDDDVATVLNCCEDDIMKNAILLAAFAPMRRGEICALTDGDIKGQYITVSKSMAWTKDEGWFVKVPKTEGSYRTILMPKFVISRIAPIKGRIVPITPTALTNRFIHIVRRSGVPYFRFHDLRHYAVSAMHAIGVPDKYIMQRGGWETPNVMRRVYLDVLPDVSQSENKKIVSHFTKLMIKG